MIMQDSDFALCLKGLTTVRLITAEHSKDKQSPFFTFCAILIESGLIERLIWIIGTSESEFSANETNSINC